MSEACEGRTESWPSGTNTAADRTGSWWWSRHRILCIEHREMRWRRHSAALTEIGDGRDALGRFVPAVAGLLLILSWSGEGTTRNVFESKINSNPLSSLSEKTKRRILSRLSSGGTQSLKQFMNRWRHPMIDCVVHTEDQEGLAWVWKKLLMEHLVADLVFQLLTARKRMLATTTTGSFYRRLDLEMSSFWRQWFTETMDDKPRVFNFGKQRDWMKQTHRDTFLVLSFYENLRHWLR